MSRPDFPEFETTETVGIGAINADEWLESAIKKVDYYMGDGAAEATPILTASFMIASAISYQADRQVDAAELIARAILQAGKDQGNG